MAQKVKDTGNLFNLSDEAWVFMFMFPQILFWATVALMG